MKEENYKWYHRNTKDCKKLLQLHGNRFENLGKMDKFLETCNIPQLNDEEGESLNRLLTAVNWSSNQITRSTQKPLTGQFYRRILQNI